MLGWLGINDQWDKLVATIWENLSGLSLSCLCLVVHCLHTARWSNCPNLSTYRQFESRMFRSRSQSGKQRNQNTPTDKIPWGLMALHNSEFPSCNKDTVECIQMMRADEQQHLVCQTYVHIYTSGYIISIFNVGWIQEVFEVMGNHRKSIIKGLKKKCSARRPGLSV